MKKLQFFEAVQFAQEVKVMFDAYDPKKENWHKHLGMAIERTIYKWYPEHHQVMTHSGLDDCFFHPHAIVNWLEAIIEEEWVEDIKQKLYSYEQGRSTPAAE